MSIINIEQENFEKEVLSSKKKVVIDFNADWCGPCRMLAPILEEISEKNDKVKVVSINVDNNEDLAREYKVFSIPCLVLIENGKEVNRSVGLKSKSEIEEFIGE